MSESNRTPRASTPQSRGNSTPNPWRSRSSGWKEARRQRQRRHRQRGECRREAWGMGLNERRGRPRACRDDCRDRRIERFEPRAKLECRALLAEPFHEPIHQRGHAAGGPRDLRDAATAQKRSAIADDRACRKFIRRRRIQALQRGRNEPACRPLVPRRGHPTRGQFLDPLEPIVRSERRVRPAARARPFPRRRAASGAAGHRGRCIAARLRSTRTAA